MSSAPGSFPWSLSPSSLGPSPSCSRFSMPAAGRASRGLANLAGHSEVPRARQRLHSFMKIRLHLHKTHESHGEFWSHHPSELQRHLSSLCSRGICKRFTFLFVPQKSTGPCSSTWKFLHKFLKLFGGTMYVSAQTHVCADSEVWLQA